MPKIALAGQASNLVYSSSSLTPSNPLLGTINLSTDPTKPTTEQFQTEISASVKIGGKLFILSSGGGSTLQVTDATNPAIPGAPAAPVLQRVSFGAYNSQSVATFGTLVAVALSPSDYATTAGKGLVRFYRIAGDGSLTMLRDVEVGYLPDSIAFNKQGTNLVIANEGEPIANYAIDRPGNIGIIDIKDKPGKESFSYSDLNFDGLTLPPGIRISGPTGTTQVNDLEPEYVSILGKYAYVTLQENNGVAKVNLETRKIEKIFALGTVDFKNQLVDLSDRDGAGGTNTFKPLMGQAFEGLRMADGIAAYQSRRKDYFITANEGDSRDYGTYVDEIRGSGVDRVKRLTDDARVGEPSRTTTFGSRSISIFDADAGTLVWDSGNSLQSIAVAARVYDDGRSDDKGVEPESIVVAKVNGRNYAIASVERTTKTLLAVFDVTDPAASRFVTSTVIDGSLSPEGLKVITAKNSSTGRDLLVVSNEVSNTLNFLDLEALIASPAVAGAGTFESTMLKDVAGGPELKISSLITNGEFTNGLAPGSSLYAPVGIFDGMGAYNNPGNGSYTLLVNHELGSTAGYQYQVLVKAGATAATTQTVTGARISRFVVDKDVDNNSLNGFQSRVVAGGVAYDEVISPNATFSLGSGITRFCGANYIEAGQFSRRGFADSLYLAGEETTNGKFFALDAVGAKLYHVPAFGLGGWESATAVDTGSKNTVAVMLFDDSSGTANYIYLWVGTKASGSSDLLERNGIAANSGSLYAWKADSIANTQAGLAGVALNTSIAGGWVSLGSGTTIAALSSAAELRSLASTAGAMQFTRIEDGDVNPTTGKQVVFNTTGGSGVDLYGNTQILDLAVAFGKNGLLAAGANTSLRVIVDSDRLTGTARQDGIRSQDNLAWSKDGSIYVQEDKSLPTGTADGSFGSKEASIWKVDPLTGLSTRWAQIDRTSVPTTYGQSDSAPADIGNWESSGIIDVSKIYGAAAGSFFLANVQAHSLTNGNLWGAGYLGVGGQIDLIQQIEVG